MCIFKYYVYLIINVCEQIDHKTKCKLPYFVLSSRRIFVEVGTKNGSLYITILTHLSCFFNFDYSSHSCTPISKIFDSSHRRDTTLSWNVSRSFSRLLHSCTLGLYICFFILSLCIRTTGECRFSLLLLFLKYNCYLSIIFLSETSPSSSSVWRRWRISLVRTI